MKRTVVVIALLFALSLLAVAHGKEKHVMGTVTNISGTSIAVETSAKKSVTIEVNDKTKFEKSGAAATLKDLKVGDKVVVHADMSDKLVANEVHFGPPGKVHGRDEGNGGHGPQGPPVSSSVFETDRGGASTEPTTGRGPSPR